ncbi:heterokaryon incompatibility protein-domain-containing protein [Xylaria bambusicola]|uniref:heterokaryon incompatibility protein-domain-containing protein n=1 Tax=Xylaria bambusicola TaxID=326684 RepID=UPI002008E6A2|nr:heterokaryon incompatibility protein-domain-containing protein [Xylaria bambusicola]KAI0528003.1 heterokaryon incompatibility protein-domain-containing protein [Xylaria bambusicola]
MRLLHTTTRTLYTFTDRTIPRYAILSHTWQENEVTFQDMKLDVAEKMIGYRKVEMACSVSAARGFQYVWLDTCCIDKTSSAELSEAINSMYRWYEGAGACFAFLVDVDCDASVTVSHLRESSWFKRGWTLQELIAPAHIIFDNAKWEPIGTKAGLKQEISSITGVPIHILSGDSIDTVSTAQIMSWASMRDTTRIEDIAYCLMGLFDVNMPLLYGEGEKAFIRLQEEIMKQSDDYSLFAWRSHSDPDQPSVNSGRLLAPSPAAFADSGNVIQLSQFSYLNTIYTPLTISNKGIHLTLPVVQADGNNWFALLNCTEEGRGGHCLALKVEALTLSGEYFTVHSDRLLMMEISNLKGSVRNICVRRERYRKNTTATLKRQREVVDAKNNKKGNDGVTGSKKARNLDGDYDGSPRFFACPYYKHSPATWKNELPCSGWWISVHRLKEHLFRWHALPKYECDRCHEHFEDMDTLQSHKHAAEPCQPKAAPVREGFDQAQDRDLKSQGTDGTDEEIWQKMYQILFPREAVPSPYYDKIQRNEELQQRGMEESGHYLREISPIMKRVQHILSDTQGKIKFQQRGMEVPGHHCREAPAIMRKVQHILSDTQGKIKFQQNLMEELNQHLQEEVPPIMKQV